MSAILELDAIDLDFTYGDEYAHLSVRPGKTLCGARASAKHQGHGRVLVSEIPPKNCPGCGAPVCPTCAHIHTMDWELR